MRSLFCIFGFFIVFSYKIRAQDAIATTEQLIADIFEQYTAESEDQIDYNTFYEELMFCAENPINLNHTNREELQHLLFLSDIQIENILAYVYQNEKLETLYELQLIQGIDMTDIRRLLPFVKVENVAHQNDIIYWNDIKSRAKNELYFRLDKGLEKKEGYTRLPENETTDENKTKYTGNEIYNSIKYRFRFKDKIHIGLTVEKDPGEQLFGKTKRGYDFFSCSAQVNNTGIFKTIVLGDFKACFGQGIVVNNETGFGKSSYVLNVINRKNGLKKYGSTDENNFFRGLGITLKYGTIDFSAFYSNKFVDADTTNNSFSSFYRTGLHRTNSEIDKKHTVNEQIIGVNINCLLSKTEIGFTAVHSKFNAMLIPDKTVYNRFYFEGNTQNSVGINYRARWEKLNLFGEGCLTTNNAIASINGCSFSPGSQLSLVALHRYYSPNFDSFYAAAFAENSKTGNETGTYFGLEIRPFKKWKIATYADSFQFRWPKFGVDAPSIGYDFLLQADFEAHRNMNMFWRLKCKTKERNTSSSNAVMPVVSAFRNISLRYNLNYNIGNFNFKNTVEGNLTREGYLPYSYGFTAFQDISYALPTIPLKIDIRYQFFDAIDYNNRFYTYEKDLLYAFSIPMFYGLGSRYYLNIKYEITNKIAVWVKFAQTIYADDRTSISSSNERISGNIKSDVRCMLKWSF